VVIKSIRDACYKLSEGDLIRLGRVVYGVRKIGGGTNLADKTKPLRVKEITDGGLNTKITNWDHEAPYSVLTAEGIFNEETNEVESEHSCRICF
jgi:hypothetical protein